MNVSDKEKQFNDLIIEWNKKINLVSRKKKDVYDMIGDSKIFLQYLPGNIKLNILDLGTGGGFPGIIIALNRPDSNLVLNDSIQKKINAVNDIINKLGLKNANAVWSRAEALAENREYKNHFDYVIARSVASLDELANWSKMMLKRGGLLIALKGGNIEKEFKNTKNLPFVKDISIEEKNERKIILVRFN